MSTIPFKRLDGSNKKIIFRSPTVEDCRNYAGLPENMEQTVLTEYLNGLQLDKHNPNKVVDDSSYWTAEDRLTALFIIYINSASSTIISQIYDCKHCNTSHGRQIDLIELANTVKKATSPMEKSIDLPSIKSGRIVPLYGFAMEFLEELKNSRDEHDDNSKEWGEANYDMRIYEVACRLRFDDDDKEKSSIEQIQDRFEYLLTLQPEREYQLLAIEVKKAMIEMHHGLPTTYQGGQIKVITPSHECDEKEGRRTNLLQPFHYHEYLPNIQR